MQATNPATEEKLQLYNNHTSDEVNEIVGKTQLNFELWKTFSIERRAKLLREAARILRKRKDSFSRLITAEMGKTLSSSAAEIDKCALVCEYYAEHASGFLKRELVATHASESFVTYEPLGIIFAIMPWNFPFWQVFRFAAPTLMAGNAALLKHAPNVPGCAQAIEAVFKEAGFPDYLFRNLLIDHDQAGELIANEHVKAVTLTGSERAGKAVASSAGAALKKCVLELGGSDPYLIFEDADIEDAVKSTVKSRLRNNGQTCISAKRIIVPKAIFKQVEIALIAEMQKYTVGDPTAEETNLGPMVGKKYREQLHDQVRKSIEAGAECILGGEIPKGRGFFYPPTLLKNVKPGMPAYDEELFGPVAALIEVNSEEEAIEVANDTSYGLGAAIFSKNVDRAKEIAAQRLSAGSCFVNDFVQSDPRLPFGGINQSGFGRELADYGVREFTNVKTVFVK